MTIKENHLYRAGYKLATETPHVGQTYAAAPLDFPQWAALDPWRAGHRAGVVARWYGVDLIGFGR